MEKLSEVYLNKLLMTNWKLEANCFTEHTDTTNMWRMNTNASCFQKFLIYFETRLLSFKFLKENLVLLDIVKFLNYVLYIS